MEKNRLLVSGITASVVVVTGLFYFFIWQILPTRTIGVRCQNIEAELEPFVDCARSALKIEGLVIYIVLLLATPLVFFFMAKYYGRGKPLLGESLLQAIVPLIALGVFFILFAAYMVKVNGIAL